MVQASLLCVRPLLVQGEGLYYEWVKLTASVELMELVYGRWAEIVGKAGSWPAVACGIVLAAICVHTRSIQTNPATE